MLEIHKFLSKKKSKWEAIIITTKKTPVKVAQILGWGLFEAHCFHFSQELRKYWKLGKTFKVVCTTNEWEKMNECLLCWLLRS